MQLQNTKQTNKLNNEILTKCHSRMLVQKTQTYLIFTYFSNYVSIFDYQLSKRLQPMYCIVNFWYVEFEISLSSTEKFHRSQPQMACRSV